MENSKALLFLGLQTYDEKATLTTNKADIITKLKKLPTEKYEMPKSLTFSLSAKLDKVGFSKYAKAVKECGT